MVCLPSTYSGGELLVTHNGRTACFDWSSPPSSSNTSPPSSATVKWAAFYSDCKHEVLRVTSGHRCTLTYNLYHAASTSVTTTFSSSIPTATPNLPTIPRVLNPASLPLHTELSAVLSTPAFLRNGGVLAFHCDHAYATSTKPRASRQHLPSALKGIDAAVFSVLQNLNLRVEVRPRFSGAAIDRQRRGRLAGERHYEARELLEQFRSTGETRVPVGTKRRMGWNDGDGDGDGWMGRETKKVDGVVLLYEDPEEGCVSRMELEDVDLRRRALEVRRRVAGVFDELPEMWVGRWFSPATVVQRGGEHEHEDVVSRIPQPSISAVKLFQHTCLLLRVDMIALDWTGLDWTGLMA